ncbi:MAG: heat-shock protein Hsp20 [Candidatus Muiribacterium halophilum]|uniref:Heat-shock protein Hsp20 n=1 Tax=Muiribacterium halophilum TaxID=2053465 RepID=A0A2N5ZDI7_MUIH1|nr:MAG: heat-shock protein Hsp20 [Candidatus Muirbacterium halophilum]
MKLTKYRNRENWLDKSFFNDFFNLGPVFPEMWKTEGSFKVDVYSKDNKLNIDAELPSVKKEDITLELTEGVLTITTKKEKSEEVKEDDYYYSERSYGTMSRSFNVGSEITEDDINAEFKDGLLHIELPKKEIVKNDTKKITIK